jgi:Leucine-rich repeat (LRR) protein
MRTKPHRIRSIIVALLVLNTFVGLTWAQEVTIPDPGLNAAIRAALAKPIGPLTVQDLLSLTNLDAGNRSISNLTGREFATNLLSLNLRGNLLSNPTFPTTLTRLNSLDLSQKRFSTLTCSIRPPRHGLCRRKN